jgi:hypothetical protein
VESEDDDGHGREERVVLKLEEERRSKFENFNLWSTPNPIENTVEDGGDQWKLCWLVESKEMDMYNAKASSNKIMASSEAEAWEIRRRREEKGEEREGSSSLP